MASTVIDELIVTLGLDASKFTEGQKKAAQSLVDMRGKVTESSDAIGSALGSLSKKFVALFLSFEALKTVASKIKETTLAFRDLNVMVELLGTSSRSLAIGAELGRFGGGTSADIGAWMLQQQQAVMGARFGQGLPGNAMGMSMLGLPWNYAPSDTKSAMIELHDALKRAPFGYGGTTSGRAQYGMGMLGLPQSMAAEAALPDAQFYKQLNQAVKDNASVTDRETAAARDLTNVFISADTRLTNLTARSLPALDKVARGVEAEFNKGLTDATKLVEAGFRELKTVLDDIENSSFVKWIKTEFGPHAPGDTSGTLGFLGRAQADVRAMFSGHLLSDIFGEGFARNIPKTPGAMADWLLSSPASAGSIRGSGLLDHLSLPPIQAGAPLLMPAALGGAGSLIGGAQSSNTLNVGAMNINTQARDSDGIAASIQQSVARKFSVSQADSGVVV